MWIQKTNSSNNNQNLDKVDKFILAISIKSGKGCETLQELRY